MAASFAIKSWVEGGVLAALILIDLVIGFFQDMQAARIVASLKSLQSSTAIVWRDGSYQAIDAKTLVPGDFIELKTGDIVPADARLVDATSLETDEALLTGESLPVRKDPDVMLDRQDVSPGDRLNVLFSSTIITKGRGHAIIFATGSFTEIGKIAAALKDQGTSEEAKKKPQRDIHKPLTYFAPLKFAILNLCRHIGSFLGLTVGTPLQRKLSRLFLYVFALAILFAIIVLAANKVTFRYMD
jgi:magnesium-transporting ATPase (P-type)